jgi:hypothetical protein
LPKAEKIGKNKKYKQKHGGSFLSFYIKKHPIFFYPWLPPFFYSAANKLDIFLPPKLNGSFDSWVEARQIWED